MVNSIITAFALFGASALAQSVGSAHVVNMCSYDVQLNNVPASGGGYDESDETLASGQSWSHDWTQLTNGAGWSIKLSKSDSMADILQYEYTFNNDGTIWYDLSCVNGNPWDANWEISSSGNCSPKQQAYRFATDDAYGEQSCPQDASITVTLCSGEATNNGSYGNVVSGANVAAAPASSAAAVAVATPVTYAPLHAVAAAATYGYNWNNDDVSASLKGASATPVVTPTTFATQVTAIVLSANGAEATEVETVWVVDTVTQIAGKPRARRHEHGAHHAHHRHA